jgi:hypothetical protein
MAFLYYFGVFFIHLYFLSVIISTLCVIYIKIETITPPFPVFKKKMNCHKDNCEVCWTIDNVRLEPFVKTTDNAIEMPGDLKPAREAGYKNTGKRVKAEPTTKTIVSELPRVDKVYEDNKKKIIQKAEDLKATARAEALAKKTVRRVRRYDISGAELRITEGQITIDNFEYAELLYCASQLLEANKQKAILAKLVSELSNTVKDIKKGLSDINLVVDEFCEE